MDISVSRLNNRMTLQVPSELPLGLVFITGQVGGLSAPIRQSDQSLVAFQLLDEHHQLPCRVPQQVIEETQMEQGDRIRVSGHLLFDSRSVQYYLLARDLEVLPAASGSLATAPAMTAQSVKQRAQAASLVQGDLPPWVKQLAPREVQAELGLLAEPEETGETPPVPSQSRQIVEEQPEELPQVMLSFLSSAIDSDEDIELTPAMIRDYFSEETEASSPVDERAGLADGIPATGPATVSQERHYKEGSPARRSRTGSALEEPPAVHPSRSTGGDEQEYARRKRRWELIFAILLLVVFTLLLLTLLWSRLGVELPGIL